MKLPRFSKTNLVGFTVLALLASACQAPALQATATTVPTVAATLAEPGATATEAATATNAATATSAATEAATASPAATGTATAAAGTCAADTAAARAGSGLLRPSLQVTGTATVTATAPATGTAQATGTAPVTGTPPTPEPTEVPVLTDPNLTLDTITGLTEPTSLVELAPDDLLVTEKSTGRVVRVQDGEVGDAVLDLATNYFDERGTLGITLHPDFAENCFVYVYWTWTGEGTEPAGLLGADSEEPEAVPELGNRVDRFIWDGSTLTFDQNIIQLRTNTLTDTTGRVRGNHDGGVITFGPDGMLYIIIGDQNLRGQLQNVADGPAPAPETLTGVILRLNDDGSAPDDNPFADQGEELAKVFVYGIRNSFGITFDPLSGALWQTENGDDAYDEINYFDRGENSGWIQLLGLPERFDDLKALELASPDGFDNPEWPPSNLAESAEAAQEAFVMLPGSIYRPPVFTWRHPPALTALAFLPDNVLGDEMEGDLLVGAGLSGSILRFDLTEYREDLLLEGPLEDRVDDNAEKGELAETEGLVFASGVGIVTDIEPATDGSVWVVSYSTGTLFRISAP